MRGFEVVNGEDKWSHNKVYDFPAKNKPPFYFCFVAILQGFWD